MDAPRYLTLRILVHNFKVSGCYKNPQQGHAELDLMICINIVILIKISKRYDSMPNLEYPVFPLSCESQLSMSRDTRGIF